MIKRITIYITTGLVLFAVFAVIMVSTHETPETRIQFARQKLYDAESLGSSKYAGNTYYNAKRYYDSAMMAWQAENQKWIILRDYERSVEFARLSAELSAEAAESTKKSVAASEELLAERIAFVRSRIYEFENRYGNFPFDGDDRNELTKSKIILDEGILAYNKMNYTLCRLKLDSAEMAVSRLHEIYHGKILSYFTGYGKWEKWVGQCIAGSRINKTYCIIVDKFARECHLYKNGTMLHNYKIELGMNWLGDKTRQGDKATPEGLYKIVSKKSNGATKFYKAFLLDYPNEDDKKRFLLNKENGLIEQNARMGSLIEIHGNGGHGVDWTDGCISLQNIDMDMLFALCPEGTRIAIVGSVKPLNSIFPENR